MPRRPARPGRNRGRRGVDRRRPTGADCALHPRERHADGPGVGRGRGGNCRPHRGDAGGARQPGRRQRRPGTHCGRRGRRPGARSPGQRRADRGPPGHCRRRELRRGARAGSRQRQRRPAAGPRRVHPRRDAAQEQAACRRRSSISGRPARIGRAPVRRRGQRGRAAVPVVARRPGARDGGAEGAGRYRRARAVYRRGRRTLRVGRRLRDPRHQGRLGDAGRPAARGAHRARAVRVAGRGGRP